jgi:hypothetical protein
VNAMSELSPVFEYSASVSPIMPNEARTLAKNFNCPNPEHGTFVGLPPSVKNEHNLPSGLAVALTVRTANETREMPAYVAGGRGGLLRLSLDLMDFLNVKQNAQATVSMTVDAEGVRSLVLVAG